jgi:polysaccharide export outer membrane protein
MQRFLSFRFMPILCCLVCCLLSDLTTLVQAQAAPEQDAKTTPAQDKQTSAQDKQTSAQDKQTPTQDKQTSTNPLVEIRDDHAAKPNRPMPTPLRDYRVEPGQQRVPRSMEVDLLPFGAHFFDAPRQIIRARRDYFRRMYDPDRAAPGEAGTHAGENGQSGKGVTPNKTQPGSRKNSSASHPAPTPEEIDAVLALSDEQKRDLLARSEAGTLSSEERKRYRLLFEKTPAATGSQDRDATDKDTDNKDTMDRGASDRDRPDGNTRARSNRNTPDERDPNQRDIRDINDRDGSPALVATRHATEVPKLSDADAFHDIVDPIAQLYQNVNASNPTNYQLAPGDTFLLRFGSPTLETQEISLVVDPTGGVTVPDVGRVIVRGQTPSQAEAALHDRMRDYYPGVHVSLSLKEMRTISVTVSGESYQPGVYVVPAVTTAYNLIYATGGPGENGTWRRIELRRRGALVAAIDLYQFLITGQNTADVPLESGDIIYIPGRFGQISIYGNVRRQALYEMLNGETLQQALAYSGGILPSGVTQHVQLSTVTPGGVRLLKDVDVSQLGNERSLPVYDGDAVEVFSIRPLLTNKVTIEGAVDQPGDYALTPGMTVGELVQRSRGLLAEGYGVRADLNRMNPDLTLTLIPINLERALAGDPAANLPLERWDRLTVYTRDQVAWSGRREVTVRGAVRKPGIYYRSTNMRVKDLLLQAEGTLPDAKQLVLLHQQPDGKFAIQYPSLTDVMKDDSAQNYLIQDRDVLAVYRADEAQFTPEHKINIQGEVVTPGAYPYGEGMRLSDALRLAGGLTPRAGAAIQVASARKSKEDLPNIAHYSAANGTVEPDPTLTDGDVIVIQGREDYRDTPAMVRVVGEVNNPGPVFLKGRSMRLSDVIRAAGGLSPNGYAEGAELVRSPERLATAGQKQLASVISKVNSLLNQAEYRRQLALSDIERMKAAGNAGHQAQLPVAIPGLSSEPQPVGDTMLTQQGAQSLFSHPLVSSPRDLKQEDLEPEGNVAVDLAGALRRPSGEDDLVMVDGDTLTIPQRPTTLQVIGAVIQPRSVAYRSGMSLQYYIDQAGGYTSDAARERGVVIRLGGGLMPINKVKELRPGDVILIPTRVQAAHINDNHSQIDSIFRGLTNGGLIFLVAKKLLGI